MSSFQIRWIIFSEYTPIFLRIQWYPRTVDVNYAMTRFYSVSPIQGATGFGLDLKCFSMLKMPLSCLLKIVIFSFISAKSQEKQDTDCLGASCAIIWVLVSQSIKKKLDGKALLAKKMWVIKHASFFPYFPFH